MSTALSLKPVEMLFYLEKGLAGVIKVRILTWGDFWVI